MRVARGVKLSGLEIEMKIALVIVEEVYLEHGQQSFITHTDDGVHSAPSLHPYGYAIDYRMRFFRAKVKQLVYEKIRARLPKGFDVILHRTHLHVEWDDAKKLIMIGKV